MEEEYRCAAGSPGELPDLFMCAIHITGAHAYGCGEHREKPTEELIQ